MKPLVSLSVLALALSVFAQTTSQNPTTTQTPATTQTQTIKIKSKGDDIRTVIDSIFEQAGKQYVLETNFHQSIYMNLDGASFQKALEIIGNVAMLEFEEKQGIWYVRSKAPAVKTPVTPTIKPEIKLAAKTPAKKAPSKKTKGKKTPVTKTAISAQTFASISKTEEPVMATKPTVAPKPAIDLSGKLTVQLKKMDIRQVFGEFGQQTQVEIEVDDSVPNYKLDAYFYNTSLKFALDKICKVAGLKYSFTPSKTVRISKA